MELRNMTIYSIFVRNHGGNFAAVEKDIPRIRALGADVVWLLPIHPIGQKERKGTLGSPYAIADYRAVNPELRDDGGLSPSGGRRSPKRHEADDRRGV